MFHMRFEITHLSSKLSTQQFKIKCFPLNACILSRLFQTGKVQTKVETTEQNVRWQESSSKHLFLELLGCTFRLKEG